MNTSELSLDAYEITKSSGRLRCFQFRHGRHHILYSTPQVMAPSFQTFLRSTKQFCMLKDFDPHLNHFLLFTRILANFPFLLSACHRQKKAWYSLNTWFQQWTRTQKWQELSRPHLRCVALTFACTSREVKCDQCKQTTDGDVDVVWPRPNLLI